MKSLFKAVALITLFSVLTRIAGFIFRIYLSRTIGAEALGLYQVAFSVFIVLLTIVSSGLPFIISRITAKYSNNSDKKAKGQLISSSLILSAVISIVLCVVILLFKNLFAKIFTERSCIEILIVLLPAVVFSSVYSVFRGALWGENNYFALCVSELFEQVLRILICVLLLGSTMSVIHNAVSVAWSLTISCLVSAVFVVLLYFYYGGILSRPGRVYKKVLKESTPITGVRVAGSLIQPLIALIIPMRLVSIGYTNAQALSLFGIAVGMTFPLLFIPGMLIGSLSTALVPEISSSLSEGKTKNIENRIKTAVKFTLFISSFFVPLFLGVGDIIGRFLYDNMISGTLLQVSAWIMIPMGLTNITSSILNSLGMEIKSCVNYFFGAIALFLSIWFLPSVMGINAFAVGMGISTSITSVLNIYMLKRKTKVKIKIVKPLIIFSLIAFPCAGITAFSGALLSYIFPDFFVLALSCSFGAVFFILLSMIFGVLDVNCFNVLKRRLFVRKKSKAVIKDA